MKIKFNGMHLEKIRESQGGRFDRYLIGSLIIVFTFFVAQLPYIFAVINAVGIGQLDSLEINPPTDGADAASSSDDDVEDVDFEEVK